MPWHKDQTHEHLKRQKKDEETVMGQIKNLQKMYKIVRINVQYAVQYRVRVESNELHVLPLQYFFHYISWASLLSS